jgi:GNAT superfamily N-acetyltransferase
MDVSIREALTSDAERIAQLCVQLGYEVPQTHVLHFLEHRAASGAVFVAVVARVGVVGWTSVAHRDTMISNLRADVEGLVVEDEYRGNGIGELLIASAESWARQRGCRTVRVLSNTVRERAHRFYLRLGYRQLKTEIVFDKAL